MRQACTRGGEVACSAAPRPVSCHAASDPRRDSASASCGCAASTRRRLRLHPQAAHPLRPALLAWWCARNAKGTSCRQQVLRLLRLAVAGRGTGCRSAFGSTSRASSAEAGNADRRAGNTASSGCSRSGRGRPSPRRQPHLRPKPLRQLPGHRRLRRHHPHRCLLVRLHRPRPREPPRLHRPRCSSASPVQCHRGAGRAVPAFPKERKCSPACA